MNISNSLADDTISKTYDIYVKRLPKISSVEIFALSSTANDIINNSDNAESFPLRPYSEFRKVLSKKELTGDDAKEIVLAWSKLKPSDIGVTCHLPEYGIRFYHEETNENSWQGKHLVLESSISKECSNFSVPSLYPGGDFTWFNFDSKSAQALFKKLFSFLPHPEKK